MPNKVLKPSRPGFICGYFNLSGWVGGFMNELKLLRSLLAAVVIHLKILGHFAIAQTFEYFPESRAFLQVTPNISRSKAR